MEIWLNICGQQCGLKMLKPMIKNIKDAFQTFFDVASLNLALKSIVV